MTLTVLEIIKDYLKKNGYDGLCGEECGCGIDDLAPCGQADNLFDCIPAYKQDTKTCTNTECENYDEVEECDAVECYRPSKQGNEQDAK